MAGKHTQVTNILAGYDDKNGTCLNEDWRTFFQKMKKIYGSATQLAALRKKQEEEEEEEEEELWKEVKKLCANFIEPSPAKNSVKFLGEVLSLKDPIAHLSNSFQLNRPIFYETNDKIDFAIKTNDSVTLNIEVCSLTNEIIAQDINRRTPLYKVSKESLNNPDKKLQKKIGNLRRLAVELTNCQKKANLELLKCDKDLKSIGLKESKINEIIEKNNHSLIGAQYEIGLIIEEELKRLTGIDPNEEYVFKNQEGEEQLFNIITHMIDKKANKIMKKLVTLPEGCNPLYMLILDGEPYTPKIVVRDPGFVMQKVSAYLKSEYRDPLPFDRIFIVGLKGNFWVFRKQKEWGFEAYTTILIE